MSVNDSDPEPTPESDDLGETGPPPTHPVDFTDTVERLKTRASTSRRASIRNRNNSTVVAFLAVSALLMVVVGAENVVRRALAPDIAYVAAQRLEAAHERVRIATEDAAQKSAAAVTTKAVVDSIKEEKLAAQKATEDAEALAAVRAAAFAAKADALAALVNAEAVAVDRTDALAAAETRGAGDIKLFAQAKDELTLVEAAFDKYSDALKRSLSENDQAKKEVSEIEAKLENPKTLSPETRRELRDKLEYARANMPQLAKILDISRFRAQEVDRNRKEVREAYDTAQVAAKKAKFIVITAKNNLRLVQAALAIAKEDAKRAEAILPDADDKATAAQALAKELNAPDAIKKRNEGLAKALAVATAAENIASAAQEAAKLATKTAQELAAFASTPAAQEDQQTDIQQAITRGGAVAGAIGIAILVLQIFVNSMRYYARLAEFYDAQADALLASGNDPVLASEFLEKFSPASIDFGKAPLSIYEKALDTVGKVAGGAAGRGKI